MSVSENLLARLAKWKNNTYLSLIILATIPLDHCEGTKTKQVPEGFHLERLPIINPLGEICHRCSQVFLVNCLIRRIQHVLNGIDCMVDVRLEFFVFGLLAQLLWLCQFADWVLVVTVHDVQLTDNISGYLVRRWKGLTKKPFSVLG